MIEPRVKEIIDIYAKENILGVYNYLTVEGMNVDPSTWAGKLKRMIEQKQYESVKSNIELIAYKFINLKEDGKE